MYILEQKIEKGFSFLECCSKSQVKFSITGAKAQGLRTQDYREFFSFCRSLEPFLQSKASVVVNGGSYSTSWRSSYPEIFYKKGVPKNFAKFTGKHLCQSLLQLY